MKTSVSTYSYGRYIDENKLGIRGVIEHAKKVGFDGIEFYNGEWQESSDSAKKVKEYCKEIGITPVALLVDADFINRGGEDGREEVKRLKRLVDRAADLGVSMMRHDVTSGIIGRHYNRGYDDVLPFLADRIREVTVYAEGKGIKTMTENHGFFSQDANRVEKLINAVNHPNFGALVDLGNFMCADEEPPCSVGVMAPYAFHVHAKDFFVKNGQEVNPGDGWFMSRAGNYLRGTIVGHGSACIAQSIRTMARSGYSGFVTIEFEGMEDNLLGIELGYKNLTRFIEMAK